MLIGLTVAVAVAALGGAAALYRYPLAITRWLRRQALRRAGFVKTRIPSSVGPQTVWQGGRGPLLVLLHGAGDQAATWYRVAPPLARRYRLLMPDLAGHGESQPAAGVLSLETLARALEAVLDASEWRAEPLILAGNSLGAWLSLLYASRHPARVTRLVLVDGGPVLDMPTGITLTPQNRSEARRAFEAVLDPSSRQPPGFVLDDVIRVTNRGPMARLMAAGQQDRASHLLEAEIAHLSVPVELVWGASDGLLPLAYARDLQRRLPDARLHVIEACGHAPQLERPAALLETLMRIL
jgi:pimeloyl-ACP methyl ester carboxylesterase